MPEFKRFESKLNRTSNIQILPLIDVIFFLLVFFMLFTTFRSNPEGLEINLPQADTATEQEEELRLNITIADDGNLYLDDTVISKAELELEVLEALAETSQTLFLIKADQDVAYSNVMEIMDLIRGAGGYRLALAAEKENVN